MTSETSLPLSARSAAGNLSLPVVDGQELLLPSHRMLQEHRPISR
jgi:hypothetical protein